MRKTIILCASASFFDKLDRLKRELTLLGYAVRTPLLEGQGTDYTKLAQKEQAQVKCKFINAHLEKIKKSDAILVANYDKHGIKGYIGANTFLEMAFAYALDKKIFLLNPIPEQENKIEIMGLMPIVVEGKLDALLDLL